jgi:hypothetical protein
MNRRPGGATDSKETPATRSGAAVVAQTGGMRYYPLEPFTVRLIMSLFRILALALAITAFSAVSVSTVQAGTVTCGGKLC